MLLIEEGEVGPVSATLSTAQFRCDWCGTVSEERLLAPSGIIVETPLPDGWTGIGYGTAHINPRYRVELKDPYGSQIQHLCPVCSLRPAGELIAFLSRIPEKT